MKKFIFSTIILVSAMSLAVSCDKNNDDSKLGIKDDYTASELTPDAHKAKLEEIAIEFVNYFNPSDAEELLTSAMSLVEYMEVFSYGIEGEAQEDAFMGVNSLVRGIREFSGSELAEFATRAAEDIIIDPSDTETNPFAGKCFEFDGSEWQVSDGAAKSVMFKWDDSVALLCWDGATEVEYYDEVEDVNIVMLVPTEIEITIKINGTEHLYVALESEGDDKSWSPKSTVRLYGGYEYESSSKTDDKGVEAKTSLAKNGKTIISMATVVAIDNLINVDEWMLEYYEKYNEIDLSEFVADNVRNGSAQIDILSLSILATGDFKGMYQQIEEYGKTYEYSKEYYDKVCALINDKVELIIVYNDTKEIIAEVVMQTVEEEYFDELSYYLEPVLLFPDGSKFAFEDYFNEHAFGDFMDKLIEIAEQFNDMLY